jgi:hypothetical protein
MKTENKEMAQRLAEKLLLDFKGLSAKSASKMIQSIEKVAKTLSKKFHNLQANDCEKVANKDEKLMKKVKKAVKKEKIKAKVAQIIATEKPKSMLELPLGVKNSSKRVLPKSR